MDEIIKANQYTEKIERLKLNNIFKEIFGNLGNNYISRLTRFYNMIEPYNKNNLQPASYDFTLDDTILINKSNLKINDIDYVYPDIKDSLGYETVDISKKSYYLKPNEFILCSTKEVVDLKTCNLDFLKFEKTIDLQIAGKSSLARLGIIVEEAGYIDPGFKGKITLEIFNLEKFTIELKKDMTIAQGKFSIVCGIDKLYNGKYKDQDRPVQSKYYLNYKKENS